MAILGYGVVGRALGGVLTVKLRGSVVVAFDPAARALPGRVRVVRSMPQALKGASHVFICVPSLLDGEGVEGAGWRKLAAGISTGAEHDAVVVVKSTLVPGDVTKLEAITRRRVVVCPEFLSEGTADRDILRPHRVLIGGGDKRAVDSVVSIYGKWVPRRKIIRMDAWSAQLAKLLANAMLAQRVSSINSVSVLCEKGGGDVRAIARAVGMDSRIGPHHLDASAGFGGSCLEKDLRLLCALAICLGRPEVARYWQAVIEMNDSQVRRVADEISRLAGRKGRVTLLGLAFKAGTSETRASVALRVAQQLIAKGHLVTAYDPSRPRASIDGLKIVSSARLACKGARVVAVMTEWEDFIRPNWMQLLKSSDNAIIYDTRGIVDPSHVPPATVYCQLGKTLSRT